MDKNINYLKNHYENYNYPEPVQDIEKELIEKNIVYYDDPTYNWHIIFPEKPFSKDKISILVAGCGTEQAAIIAKLSPQHEVIGIDLSSNSLKHQQKLIDKHKINNLKLICGDFRKIKFDKKFDLIISTGVIHHLDDPGSALKYFYNNIKDDGAISLMVYGDKSTHASNELRKLFFKLNFKHNKESIENVKKIYNKINSLHPGVIHSKNSSELKSDSGIVDHILHESEHFYSIKELNETIAKLVGYEGEIVWDTTRPDGQPKRFYDMTKFKETFGYVPNTTLEDGLRETIDWYSNNKETARL